MTTHKEALTLALEALNYPYWREDMWIPKRDSAIRAIKAALEAHKALAQPEQEPVAWGVDWGKAGDIACVSIIKRLPNDVIEVVAVEYAPYSYTTPPQRKPLTKEQRENIFDKANQNLSFYSAVNMAIDLTEAAHGIKGEA